MGLALEFEIPGSNLSTMEDVVESGASRVYS